MKLKDKDLDVKMKKSWSSPGLSQKMIFFDTGPIITLIMARLGWMIPKLKEKFGGHFYITPAVKFELIDRPLTVKRFEFEALQVMKLINEGILEIYDQVPLQKVKELKTLANSTFMMEGKTMDILQEGEVESVASALELNSVVVMDERTLRLFIENNKEMKKLLDLRFKADINVDQEKMERFSAQFKDLSIIRSIELVGIGYKMGLLDGYIPKMKNGRDLMLDSVLWASKFNGCAVTSEEIEEIKKYLLSLR